MSVIEKLNKVAKRCGHVTISFKEGYYYVSNDFMQGSSIYIEEAVDQLLHKMETDPNYSW